MWPTVRNRERKQSLVMLKSADTHIDRALQTAARIPGNESVEIELLYIGRVISDVRRILSDAGQGAPDELREALDIIRELRAGLAPNAIEAADQLLAKYDDD